MKQNNNSKTRDPHGIIAEMTDDELLVLLNCSPELASGLTDMTKARAKKLYVTVKHDLAVTRLNTKDKYRNGHWVTHIYVNGKRKVVEKATEDELYDYLFDFYSKQDERFMTFDDVFNIFIDYKRNMGRSESTIKEFRRYQEFIDPKIRAKQLSNITEDELRKWLLLDFLKRGYKKDALKRMLQILRAVFTFGMRRQICFENPAADILLEDYAQFCNLESKANEERSFSEEEIEKLRAYCLADNKNPHAAIMLVAMETGMRVGELTALKKEDIDDGYISVHRQQIQVPKTETNSKAFYKEVNYTKNERVNPRGGRIIPITKNCQIALDIANNLAGDSEYVFHHPDGRPVLKQSYMYYLRRRCKDLGIGISNNHAFRVAFNARLIEAGVDGNERCLVLGHSMQTNERHYSFSDKRRINDVKNKLSGLKNVL